MKKTVKIFTFIFLTFIIFNNEVQADKTYNFNNFNSCVSSNCIAMCGYNNTVDRRLYYSVYIYYNMDKSTFNIDWYDKNSKIKSATIDDSNVKSEIKENIKRGTCPKYAFVDMGDIGDVCLADNNDVYCQNLNNNTTKKVKYTGSSVKTYDYLSELSKNPNMDLAHGNTIPEFILNNNTYKGIINGNNESESNTSSNTTGTSSSTTSESNKNTKPDGYGILPQDEESQTVEEDPTEENVLGPLKGNLDKILNLISYLGPVLVVVLSSIEYLKAALNSDQDGLKKANSRFIKRLIAAVALFFVKPIVYTIINLIG